jgi:hypothetical protein
MCGQVPLGECQSKPSESTCAFIRKVWTIIPLYLVVLMRNLTAPSHVTIFGDSDWVGSEENATPRLHYVILYGNNYKHGTDEEI